MHTGKDKFSVHLINTESASYVPGTVVDAGDTNTECPSWRLRSGIEKRQ